EMGGVTAKQVLGHSVREILPKTPESWFENVKRAALEGENVEDIYEEPQNGTRVRIKLLEWFGFY
ncbi:MAG: hypothetical protein J5547_04455, partial [Clostridia bacterium]|nr:hypothetical protein [Clostridia bacterium]